MEPVALGAAELDEHAWQVTTPWPNVEHGEPAFRKTRQLRLDVRKNRDLVAGAVGIREANLLVLAQGVVLSKPREAGKVELAPVNRGVSAHDLIVSPKAARASQTCTISSSVISGKHGSDKISSTAASVWGSDRSAGTIPASACWR